jgi:hypothetical protein
MEKQPGQKLNLSSPLTLLAVKDRLRRGMPIEEFDQIIAERKTGPNKSTKVMSHAPLENGKNTGSPRKQRPGAAVARDSTVEPQ